MTKAAALMLAGCMAVLSCSEELVVPEDRIPVVEEVGAGENGPVPDGAFIVDYSIDGGPSTRAAGNGKLRISSLDYYVYEQATGELLKKRRVSVDPETQVWPMNRKNMTWEQRQALQDTLWRNTEYRILFIANVDSTLFNYGGYSESDPHPAVIRNDDSYETARILLPAVPFNDDNMYCLWEGTLLASGDDEVVNRNDIRLQRIVTRTDIRRTDEPTALYDAIERGMYAEFKSNVSSSVSTWINSFCEKINNCAHGGSTGLAHPVQGKVIMDLEEEINQLTSILQNNMTRITSVYEKQIIENYCSIIENSTVYKNRMQQWYDGSDADRKAKILYDSGQRVNAVGFDMTSYHDESLTNESPFLGVSSDGQITAIGFSGSAPENTVSQIDFYSGLGVQLFSIKDKAFCTGQRINLLYDVICDPASTINYSGENGTHNNTVNLKDIMSGVNEWDSVMAISGIDEAINYFFNECNAGHADEFDECSLEEFPIHTDLPLLSSDNVESTITLIPAWTIQQNASN